MMPRDVSTHWNSTYDMLTFAIEYRDAIDTLSGDQEFKLWRYEMTPAEWRIATQLRDVLKVRILMLSTLGPSDNQLLLIYLVPLMLFILDLQGCHALFLLCYAKSSNGHPSHGSHRQATHHRGSWPEIWACNPGISCIGKKDDKQVLQQDRWLRGIPDCYGCVTSFSTDKALLI